MRCSRVLGFGYLVYLRVHILLDLSIERVVVCWLWLARVYCSYYFLLNKNQGARVMKTDLWFIWNLEIRCRSDSFASLNGVTPFLVGATLTLSLIAVHHLFVRSFVKLER